MVQLTYEGCVTIYGEDGVESSSAKCFATEHDWQAWCALRDEWRADQDGSDSFAGLQVLHVTQAGAEWHDTGACFELWGEAWGSACERFATVSQVAGAVGKTERAVRAAAAAGRFDGALLAGTGRRGVWQIPVRYLDPREYRMAVGLRGRAPGDPWRKEGGQ